MINSAGENQIRACHSKSKIPKGKTCHPLPATGDRKSPDIRGGLMNLTGLIAIYGGVSGFQGGSPKKNQKEFSKHPLIDGFSMIFHHKPFIHRASTIEPWLIRRILAGGCGGEWNLREGHSARPLGWGWKRSEKRPFRGYKSYQVGLWPLTVINGNNSYNCDIWNTVYMIYFKINPFITVKGQNCRAMANAKLQIGDSLWLLMDPQFN